MFYNEYYPIGFFKLKNKYNKKELKDWTPVFKLKNKYIKKRLKEPRDLISYFWSNIKHHLAILS